MVLFEGPSVALKKIPVLPWKSILFFFFPNCIFYVVKFRLFEEIATKSVLERYYKGIRRNRYERKTGKITLSVQISVFKHALLSVMLLDSPSNSCLDKIACFTDHENYGKAGITASPFLFFFPSESCKDVSDLHIKRLPEEESCMSKPLILDLSGL